MSTFIGKGNLGGKPALKYVDTKASEEARPVAEMRVYFDHRRPDGDGGYRDEGGFWADVTIWGTKAETAARVLPKGARVCVFGTLYKQRWTDKQTGQPREEDAILADDITLDLLRVEEIALRPPKDRDEAGAPEPGEELTHESEAPDSATRPGRRQRSSVARVPAGQ